MFTTVIWVVTAVRTMVRLKINKTTEPALHVKYISGRHKTEPKQNRTRGFFQNRTEVQKPIPHIPSQYTVLESYDK